MTETTSKTLAQAEAEPWHEITLQRTKSGWHWSLKTYASFDDNQGKTTDSSKPYRSAASAAAAAEAEIKEPGRALRIAREALAAMRNTPRPTPRRRVRYEIRGDDGAFRPLERQGRRFMATMAPGTTEEWKSLREAAAAHTVRRIAERRT
jgi:hypothetical protein